MKSWFIFAAGSAIYVLFFGTVLYEIGFVGDHFVPRTLDHGPISPPQQAVVIDLVWIGLFGVQHSVMARAGFKRLLMRWIPAALERSLYVLASSLVLLLLFWQWRPVAGIMWELRPGLPSLVLTGLFWIGWLGVVGGSFLIDHFDLFGLRQVYLQLVGREYTPLPFRQPTLYRYLRHPMMLGFLIAFWATPRMTVGHLLFAVGMTVVILIGVVFEEKDLRRRYGEAYEQYRRQVPMLFPWLKKQPNG